MSVALDELPEDARTAWLRLRDDLGAILGGNLLALWAHGGTTFPDRPRRRGDLDTYAVLERAPDTATCRAIDEAQTRIGREEGAEWDAWYVLAEAARDRARPCDACRDGRLDESWAIERAHWHGGQYAPLFGPSPEEIVPAPTWAEITVDLRSELDHLERHVAAGDDDPVEATYAIFNGCRILRALETRDVIVSKRSAGAWGLEHLSPPWHPAIRAAWQAYDGEPTPEDVDVLRGTMSPFVAMVAERLTASEHGGAGASE
jgi:aminoglycoside adenylyltransferase-like protein